VSPYRYFYEYGARSHRDSLKNSKTAEENVKTALAIAAMRTAHPWEPYPLYKPKTRRDRIHFCLIRLRWFLVKRFIKNKSFLNGRLLYDD